MEQLEIGEDFTSGKTKRKNHSPKNAFLLVLLVLGLVFLCGYISFKYGQKIQSLKSSKLESKLNPKKYVVMVGDIGGTNVRLSLVRISKDPKVPKELIDRKTMNPLDFPSIDAVFESYLSKYQDENYPLYGVIGVPGPVKNNIIYGLVNIPHWADQDGNKIQKKFGFKKFTFLNDFACNGYGIQADLKLGEDYIIINEGEPVEGGSKAIIGPGSGLGMGYLLKDHNSKYYTIGGSEGGHQDFTPKGDKYLRLREFTLNILKEKKLDSLSVERLVSGQGLIPMYKFLLQEEPNIEKDEELAKLVSEVDFFDKKEVNTINIELVNKGLNRQCKLSTKVLELFVELFGEIAGDISLFSLPTNGLYLVGGMSLALQNLIKNTPIFMEHYLKKDGQKSLLKSFPIYLVLNGELGILGATECARRLLENEP